MQRGRRALLFVAAHSRAPARARLSRRARSGASHRDEPLAPLLARGRAHLSGLAARESLAQRARHRAAPLWRGWRAGGAAWFGLLAAALAARLPAPEQILEEIAAAGVGVGGLLHVQHDAADGGRRTRNARVRARGGRDALWLRVLRLRRSGGERQVARY